MDTSLILGDVVELVDGSDPSGGTGEPWLHGGPLPLGPSCDDAPTIVTEERCGRSVVREAHFVWTGCESAGGLSDGFVDVVRAMPEDGACEGREGGMGLEEVASIGIDREAEGGRRLSTRGTLRGVMREGAVRGERVRVIELDITRTMSVGDGAFSRSAHLSGTIEVRRSFDNGAPSASRVLSGRVEVVIPDGRTVAAELDDVVRVPREECAWPMAGQLTRTLPDSTVSTLVFGPACGHGVLDGESVELSTLRRAHGRRAR